MAQLLAKPPGALAAGQQQRAVLARAMGRQPPVVYPMSHSATRGCGQTVGLELKGISPLVNNWAIQRRTV